MFAKFEGIRDAVSLHMVEVSPKLSEMQQEKLSGTPASQCNSDATNPTEGRPCVPGQNQSTITGAEEMPSSDKLYKSCQSKHGVPVSWYRNLQDVPQGFSFYVAHEFFDALPVHKFQVGSWVWVEFPGCGESFLGVGDVPLAWREFLWCGESSLGVG